MSRYEEIDLVRLGFEESDAEEWISGDGNRDEIFISLDMNKCPSCEIDLEKAICYNCETNWEDQI